MAILAALWWAWESYVWLGNTAGSDEGAVRVVLLSAMGAMLIASLAVPRAFGDDGVIFGVAYLAVRVLHLGAYATSRATTRSCATWSCGWRPRCSRPRCCSSWPARWTAPRRPLWVAALAIDYGGLVARGIEGWRVWPSTSPSATG